MIDTIVINDAPGETRVALLAGDRTVEVFHHRAGRESIVYTDRFQICDAEIFCGYRYLTMDYGKSFSSGRVYLNGLKGFWSYAKERLVKHHGMHPKRFPLYLREQEFRYNHRAGDAFPMMAQCLSDFVPNRG